MERSNTFFHQNSPHESTSYSSSAQYKYSCAYEPMKWSSDEDSRLLEAVEKFGDQNWKQVAHFVETRDSSQCVQRWNRSLRPDIIKGRWRPKEDNILIELVRSYSEIKAIPWTNVAMKIPGRTSKQCRERWFNFLDPSLKRRVQWSEDEDKKLLELGKQLGCKWSLMSRQLPGRTANAVKVRYYALERHELSNKRDTANCDDESDTASTPITPIPSETTSEAQDSVDSMPPLSASVSNDSHIWNSDPQIWSTFQANTTQEVNPMFQYYINQFQPFLYNGGSEPFLTNVDANITYHQFRQQNALGINVHFHIQAQIDQLKLQLMYLKQLQDQCPN